MTVSTTSNRVIYRGNGAATSFAVPFKVIDEDHLVVRRRVFTTSLFEHTYVGTDYSYAGLGDPSGTLTLSGTALADTYELVIERIVPYTQDLDIVNAGGFYPETVEEQLDLIVMGMQQLDDLTDRSLLVPEGEDGLVIPSAALRAELVLGFDEDGDIEMIDRTVFRGDKGDPGGNVMSVGLFTQLGTVSISSGTNLIRTSGWAVEGSGGAFYQRWQVGMTALDAAQEGWSWRAAADGSQWFLNTDQWVTPRMFAAVDDTTFAINQRERIQKFWDWYKANPSTPINVTISAGIAPAAANDEVIITIGPDAEPSAKPARAIVGHMWLRVVAGSDPAIVICRVQNLTRTTWHGGLRAEGPNGLVTFAQRDNYAVAIELVNCGRLAFTDMCRGDRTWLLGVVASTANCNFVKFDHIWTTFNGSGGDLGSHGSMSLVGSWSAPEQGEMWDDDANPATVKVYRADPGGASTNSSDQRTRLTIDNFPPHTEGTDTLAWMHPSNLLYQVRLVGDDRLYEVRDWDIPNNHIFIYPAIDPTLGASGTFEWVFGGGWGCRSGDGQIIVDRCTVTDCGNGAMVSAQYAAKGRNWNFTSCGTGLVVGRAGGTATCMGLQVDNLYVESNTRDVCFVTAPSFAAYGYINSETALTREKVYELSQPRDYSNGLTKEVFLSRTGGWHVMCGGRQLFFQVFDEITAETYTMQLIDSGVDFRCSRGTPQTVTIPPRSSVKLRRGDYTNFLVAGAGALSFAAGAGVTVNGTLGPFQTGTFVQAKKTMEPDTWRIFVFSGGTDLPGTTTNGDVSVVLIGASTNVQRFDTALTAARTVTLPAPGNLGRRFHISRTANATGAFDLTIQTSAVVALKVLNVASMWATVEDDGTEYRLIEAGTL